MPPSTSPTGYSATVDLQLIVGDRSLELGQIGPGMICVRERCELPPCEATVVMQVDDYQQRWPVYLPDGLSLASDWARTVARDEASVEA